MITASIVSLIFLGNPADSAKEVFMQTMEHYGKLDSFSSDLEHDFSSGLFSGKYKQHLEFQKGKGFKLVVTDLKGATRPDNVAPDYFSNGTDVTTVGRHDGTRPLNTDQNTMPGYEVTGGLIFTWLLDSHTKTYFTKPPDGMKMESEWGTRKEWHREKVEEVVFKMTVGSQTQKISIFINPDHKHLIGMEAMNGDKLGWMLYRNQNDNPKLKATSFKPPQR